MRKSEREELRFIGRLILDTKKAPMAVGAEWFWWVTKNRFYKSICIILYHFNSQNTML